jgi:hypothetical protein
MGKATANVLAAGVHSMLAAPWNLPATPQAGQTRLAGLLL